MTERHTPSHDHITPVAIDGVPAYLQMDAIEALRTSQYEALHTALQEADDWRNFGDAEEFALCEGLVDAHLASGGIAPDDEHYDDAKALLMSVSVHEVPERVWHGSRDDDGTMTESRRHGTYQRLEESFRWNTSETSDDDTAEADDPADPDTVEHEIDERTRELLEALGTARDKWSDISAKVQGRITKLGISERKTAEADYQEAVRAYIRHELTDLLADPDESDEFKNVAVVQYLFNEQELLREQTKIKLNNSTVNKFVKFMNRGNLPVRIAKGVGLGVAAGFLGTLMAGAVGAGVIAGTAIGVSRFAKGYAVHSKDKVGTKSFEDVADSERLDAWHAENGDHDLLDVNADYFDETFEEDTKTEQNKRRKAFAVGAGSVAAGAALGYGLGRASELSEKGINAIKDWYSGPEVKDLTPNGGTDIDTAPDMDGDGIPDASDRDIDGDGVNNGPDDAPRDPDVTIIDGPEGLDWSDFDPDARFIEHGEGGFQTLDEMGIPEDKWEAIWQDAGAVLNEDGKTYMMDDGRWGWDHSMRLSDGDLTVLAEAAERNGVTL
jgi:hypothetical protein